MQSLNMGRIVQVILMGVTGSDEYFYFFGRVH
jgi:hypothetical protein